MSIRQGKKLIASSTTNGFSLFECKWADHILNNISWLRADTFSWQSGDVYVAAYEHLSNEYKDLYIVASGDILGEEKIYYRDSSEDTTPDITGKQYFAWAAADGNITYTASTGPKVGDNSLSRTGSPSGTITESTARSDTIDNITITYYLAEDGHKICLPDQEVKLTALYEKTGAANYYLLDTTNKQFKLPRKQKRKLIQAVKNTDGTWYNLYSDGWVEQGGKVGTLNNSRITVTLPVTMASSSYTAIATGQNDTTASNYAVAIIAPSATQIIVASTANYGAGATWQVSGYAAESAYASAGMQFEYYYVGNFEQSAVEQTAGINAETLNSKADADLGNIPANYDYVVNWQEPTSANGYTWYRKYKSGWVEQGGLITNATVYTLPVTMANTNYYVSVTWDGGKSANFYPADFRVTSLTTVSFQTTASRNGSNVQGRCWEVKGMAA